MFLRAARSYMYWLYFLVLYPGSYVFGNLRARLRKTSFLIDRRYGCFYLAISIGPADSSANFIQIELPTAKISPQFFH